MGKSTHRMGLDAKAVARHVQRFIRWLEAKDTVISVRHGNLAEDKAGKDLFVETKTGTKKYQVKVDGNTHWSGKIVFETNAEVYPRFNKKDQIGAGNKLHDVDFIAFLAVGGKDGDKIYIFRTRDYVKWVCKNYEKTEPFSTVCQGGFYSFAVKFPLKPMMHLCVAEGELDG